MGSLQERIAAYANPSANLLTQLKELDELREQVSKKRKNYPPRRLNHRCKGPPTFAGGLSGTWGNQPVDSRCHRDDVESSKVAALLS